MNKESFIKEWLNSTKEMVLEFPNEEYYHVHYNEAEDRLEYGDCTNTGFQAMGGIDCDYNFGLDDHLQNLYDYMIETIPKLSCTNTSNWFDNLNNEKKVFLWNKYVENSHCGMMEEDKIYPLDEWTINDNFPTAWDFASKVNGEKWDDTHYWWQFNRCTGWVESIERLSDAINEDALEEWATDPDNFSLLTQIQNNERELDL